MLTSCWIRKRGRIIASDTSRTPNKAPSSAALFRLFRAYFRPELPWFAVGTLFAIVTALAANAYALILGFIGDRLQAAVASTGSPEFSWIWWAVAAVIGASSARALSLYAMTMANNTGVQRSLVRVQSIQYEALIRGDYARLAGDASGSYVSRFINDVNALRDAGLRFANNFTKSIVTVVGAFAVMLWADWQITAMLMVLYPIAFGPVIALGDRIRKRAKQAQSQVGEVSSLLTEGFQSARIVKAYGLEDYQQARADAGFRERARLFLKVLADRAAVDPILEVAGGVALAGVVGFAALRISQGTATLGDLLTIIGAIGIAAPELRALGTLNAVAQEGGAAADRVFEVLEAETRVVDSPSASDLQDIKGAIVFDNVTFRYGDGPSALNGLSFSVQPGETVALVGASGSGKSTVFNLIQRLYDPQSGTIRVDGQDIRDIRSNSLRRACALVAQDATLFDDTIAANIALGRPGAHPSEIEAAARAANAHDFIIDLPESYDSPVGEAGRNLSGGQRQRIAIARALLRDAPILLLDEATSALDTDSETKVQAALARLTKGRTTLVIAHRLSTIRDADRILVLENGRLVEDGTHDTLTASNGVYARMSQKA